MSRSRWTSRKVTEQPMSTIVADARHCCSEAYC
jgi:hypothetical protein